LLITTKKEAKKYIKDAQKII